MPRETLHYWICNLPCGTRNLPSSLCCTRCSKLHHERYANVRSSERAAIDLSPDGSISIPGRIDSPLHPKQVALGVQRIEIDSALSGAYSLRALEQRGLVHEATNWNSNGDNLSVIESDRIPDLPSPSSHRSVDEILAG